MDADRLFVVHRNEVDGSYTITNMKIKFRPEERTSIH